jgi:hypothetical protein
MFGLELSLGKYNGDSGPELLQINWFNLNQLRTNAGISNAEYIFL